MSSYQEKLLAWYIARLRKLASELPLNSIQTPSQVLTADKATVDKLRADLISQIEDLDKLQKKPKREKNYFQKIELTLSLVFSLAIIFLFIAIWQVLQINNTNTYLLAHSNYLLLSLSLCLVIMLCLSFLYLKFFRIHLSNLTLLNKATEEHLSEKELFSLEKSKEFYKPAKLLMELQKENIELKEKELLIADFAPMVCLMTDSSGKVLALNKSVYQHWHFKQNDLIGKILADAIKPPNKTYLLESFENARQKRQLIIQDITFTNGQGILSDTRWHIEWSQSEDCFFCTATNINEEKQLERVKKEFVNVVSHDIRNPLMTMNLIISLMSKNEYGELPTEAQEKLSHISNLLNNLLKLSKELLDVESSESGHLHFSLDKVNVRTTIKNTLEFVSGLAKLKEITFLCNMPEEPLVLANENRLQQVLVNLLNNALAYSPQQSQINIDIKENALETIIEIKDSGPGIPEELQDSLFERFKSKSPSKTLTNNSLESNGLGLAICKAYMLAQEGSIGVKSKQGNGSIFWLKLKRAP